MFVKYCFWVIPLIFSFFSCKPRVDFQQFILLHHLSNNDELQINKVYFVADIPIDKKEFLYITGLKSYGKISVAEIAQASKNLKKKKRLKSVAVHIDEYEDKVDITFTLQFTWIFKKLMLQGIWFNKHQYVSLYKMQPGDVFDIVLHEKSAQDIKTFLYDNGYFNCNVHDEIVYKKSDKTIVTIIKIKRKQCFYIDRVTFTFMHVKKDHALCPKEFSHFEARLRKKVGMHLLESDYAKKNITKQIAYIKRFFRKRGFLDCRISLKKTVDREKKHVQLCFIIKLGKRRFLKFTGNHLFSEKEIRQDVLGLDYPSWVFSPSIIAEQLVHEYYKKGYWNVSIKPRKQDAHSVLFEIDENAPVFVENVQITDRDTGERIESLHFFEDLFKHGVFNEELLDQGVEKLKDWYLKRGYWDFTIVDKKYIKKDGGEKCKIVLCVSKGAQRFWGGYRMQGFDVYEINDFFVRYGKNNSRFDIPFNFYWLSEQKSFLLKHFYIQGYWFAAVQPELLETPIEQGKVVFVDWKIDVGKQVRFGKIFIHGDTSVPFRKILKELRFETGDVWDREKLDLTRKRLKKLDVFKTIQVQPYKIEQGVDLQSEGVVHQPVLLRLIDDDPLQARLRFGYFLTSKNFLFKRAHTYKFGSSLIIKNPTNRADKLLLNADFTLFERKLDLDYRVPDPFGIYLKNFSLIGKFRAYSNKYVHSVEILKSGSAYEAIENGFLFGLNNEYKQDYFCGVQVGNEWLKTVRTRGDLKLDTDFVGKTLPSFFIEPSIIIDKVDDKLDTKKGSLTFFSLKCMIPERMGVVTAKLMCEQSFFCQLFPDVVGCFRVRLGHILQSKFEQVQPVRRFYLGGPYSVRGYEKDSVPPFGVMEVENDDGTVEKRYNMQGGSSMFNGNVEIRFPIYKSFRGVVFQDVGVLSQTGFGGFKGQWYPATGFGFRYKTPLGAIRFDIGFKWKRRLQGDSPYAWYFTLGEAF